MSTTSRSRSIGLQAILGCPAALSESNAESSSCFNSVRRSCAEIILRVSDIGWKSSKPFGQQVHSLRLRRSLRSRPRSHSQNRSYAEVVFMIGMVEVQRNQEYWYVSLPPQEATGGWK